jgi:hypothetical protein
MAINIDEVNVYKYGNQSNVTSINARITLAFDTINQHLIQLMPLIIIQLLNKQNDVAEISLIRLIKIFATVLMLCRADLIHWGFLDAF